MQSNCLQRVGMLFHPGDKKIQPQSTYRYVVMSWVKENCLSLLGLLNICKQEKKSIYSNSSKQNSDSRGGEVNQWNMKQKRRKYSLLSSVGRSEQCVLLGHAAVICTDRHHFKSAFWDLHSVQQGSYLFVHSLYSDTWKRSGSAVFHQSKTSMSKERQALALCWCICCITYFSNWIHLFIFI